MNINNTISPLLNKYVIFNDIYSSKEVTITLPKSHLFIVYDVIKDNSDEDLYNYALKSVKIKRFEIWANISQIILLDEDSQKVARTLYGKI